MLYNILKKHAAENPHTDEIIDSFEFDGDNYMVKKQTYTKTGEVRYILKRGISVIQDAATLEGLTMLAELKNN